MNVSIPWPYYTLVAGNLVHYATKKEADQTGSWLEQLWSKLQELKRFVFEQSEIVSCVLLCSLNIIIEENSTSARAHSGALNHPT